MIDILYIDVPNEYVSRTDASLFVAQIVRTANEMSSTDNVTPTNKNYKIKTNKDMNKQLVQDIIKAGNKAMNIVPVKYVIKTKDDKYYCYDGLYYDDNHVEFNDDYDDEISLAYEDIIDIRIGEI